MSLELIHFDENIVAQTQEDWMAQIEQDQKLQPREPEFSRYLEFVASRVKDPNYNDSHYYYCLVDNTEETKVALAYVEAINAQHKNLLKILRFRYAPKFARLLEDGAEIEYALDVIQAGFSQAVQLITKEEHPADQVKLYAETEALQSFFTAFAHSAKAPLSEKGIDVQFYGKWLEISVRSS